MDIRKLQAKETAPMALLLLADPSLESIQSYLGQGECYLAQDLGVYVLLPLDQETIELKNVAVAPEAQGRGLGQQLISHALKIAKNAGFKRMEVGTGNSSVGPLRLYQKMGFKQTSVDHEFFIRHYPMPIFENGIQCRDMIRLAKDL
ncbi:GNAT family N-acetyltransferase [Fundicoccus ignavus]|uniref:GNAT family N-acetyltransferase n=1 Tax=Fundicoccus ignavus TaxID=2664442 RepID=A0A844CL78_9LACT|nr:GNAT family N-acetyltransferase [Fundicoccus ignavus]MRJ48545.1 GNAT family N-acetyltransferase [Fundicoccus ignavus]